MQFDNWDRASELWDMEKQWVTQPFVVIGLDSLDTPNWLRLKQFFLTMAWSPLPKEAIIKCADHTEPGLHTLEMPAFCTVNWRHPKLGTKPGATLCYHTFRYPSIIYHFSTKWDLHLSVIDWFKEWGLNGLGGLYAFELSLEPPQEEAPEYLGSQMKRKGCWTGCSWNCLMLVCRISPKNWSVFFCEYCFGTVMQCKGFLQEIHGQFLLSMKHCIGNSVKKNEV